MRASQGAGEKRPGEKKRKITYEALDGDLVLAEMKYKYDIVPIWITLWVSVMTPIPCAAIHRKTVT